MKHIVALSGGKDSTAMALRLSKVEPRDYIYMCTPTGDELPEMEAHWDKISNILDKPIIKLVDPECPTIYDLIDREKMLPNFRARWCTRILKIETAQEFYNKHKPAKIYVGLRADEETRTGNKLYDDDIVQSFPMQEWSWGIKAVWDYLDEKNVTIPQRTDCAMCFYQRIGEWWNLWAYYPDRYKKISNLEDKIGHTLMTPGKHKIWPHKLSDLSIEFGKGRIPREIKNRSNYKQCRACSL